MNKEKPFSFFKGYTYTFEEDGQVIDAWFSSLTGLETVHVDGELVSSQRNFSTNSTNTFTVGANEYSTNLSVSSLFKGPFVCTLLKNGQEHKRQKLVFPAPKLPTKKGSFIKEILIWLVLGAGFGFTASRLDLPSTYFWVSLAVIVIGVFAYHIRKLEVKPVIEEELV